MQKVTRCFFTFLFEFVSNQVWQNWNDEGINSAEDAPAPHPIDWQSSAHLRYPVSRTEPELWTLTAECVMRPQRDAARKQSSGQTFEPRRKEQVEREEKTPCDG